MSSHYAKPENALRKAHDLVKVGKPSSAIKTLQNILQAKRYRIWSPTHEKIMYFYIELAVDLRRSVKDALLQYRQICQQAQTGSMEKVMKHYQKMCEEKAVEAQKKAAEATAAAEAGKDDEVAVAAVNEVEDLEEESPESIMLAAMSGEGTKERLDRQILTPWVKYLWECYRTVLDIIRNNARLESLYHTTARAAFDFCKRFQRNMEFRRLCEILRNHLISINKYQNQNNAVDLNSAETQKLYLETRFMQLKMAAELELWQEAYRTIEDIHENMRLGARVEPPPELMKTYYEKLSQIFWASSNYLFHAYSLHRYYQLSAQEGTVSDATVVAESSVVVPSSSSSLNRTNLASAVVLSALIISGNNQLLDLNDIDSITGVEHEGNMKLAQLLGFKKESPSRQRIINAVQTSGVLSDASALSKNIFRLLENQFGPLTLYQQLKPMFEQLKQDPELSRYVAPLEQLTVVRVLQQLSTVFKSMKIAKFISLVPNIGSVYALERLIMSGISSELLNLRFDHRNMTLIFPEADLENAKMRDTLVHLGKNVISLAHTLEAASAGVDVNADKIKERAHVFKLIQANLAEEHENVFLRQELIEKRKQELERMLLDREKRVADEKAAARRAREEEERRRLAEESAKREAERLRKENSERELRTKQQLADEMRKKLDAVKQTSTTLAGTTLKAEKKIQALTQDLENIDKIQLMRAQEEILKAQQREIERRRKEGARRIDYTVRAMRVEEREQLLAKIDRTREEEKEQFEADFAKYLEQDQSNHAKALIEKTRLERMLKEKSVFQDKLMQRRMEIFQTEKSDQDKRLAVKAEKRRVAEERRRKEEELRERERQQQLEKERLAKEEEDRKLAAEQDRKRKIEDEKREKLRLEDEAAQARLRREAELEARDRERRSGAAASEPRAAAAGGGSAWRREGDRDREVRREGDRDFRRAEDRDRPERDLGDFRSRAAAADEPKKERDGEFRARNADERGSGWRDAPRREDRDAPRREDRDAPRREDRDAPRREDRDAPRREDREDRFGGRREGDRDRDSFRRTDDREAPRRDNFRREDRDNREPREFRRADERDNREARRPDERRQGGDRDRDWGAVRKSEDREVRSRRDENAASETPAASSASSSSSSAAPATDSKPEEDDDGFTTVKKSSRR